VTSCFTVCSAEEVHCSYRSASTDAAGRAFRDAYGVEVETIGPDDPFVAELAQARAT
jgi:hypothetical protein